MRTQHFAVALCLLLLPASSALAGGETAAGTPVGIGKTVPDFRLTHPASGKEVFVEVFGFWRKGDIEQVYRRLKRAMPGKFVLCVSEQYRADEADEVFDGIDEDAEPGLLVTRPEGRG